MERRARYYGMSLKDLEEQRASSHKDAVKRYQMKHNEEIAAYQKEYYRLHKERIDRYSKAYYESHKGI